MGTVNGGRGDVVSLVDDEDVDLLDT